MSTWTYLKHMGTATRNGLFFFFFCYIFHAHVLCSKFLVSLQSSARDIKKKNTTVEANLLRNTLREISYYALPIKALIHCISRRDFLDTSLINKQTISDTKVNYVSEIYISNQ